MLILVSASGFPSNRSHLWLVCTYCLVWQGVPWKLRSAHIHEVTIDISWRRGRNRKEGAACLGGRVRLRMMKDLRIAPAKRHMLLPLECTSRNARATYLLLWTLMLKTWYWKTRTTQAIRVTMLTMLWGCINLNVCHCTSESMSPLCDCCTT